MIRSFLVALCLVAVLTSGCKPEPIIKRLKFENIVVLSDLSNRILSQEWPQKDSVVIEGLIGYFKNECVKPGEKIGDRSSIMFSMFNGNTIFKVDLSELISLEDKQQFVNSTGKYSNNGLEKRLALFQDSIKSLYAYRTNTGGLDLISGLLKKTTDADYVKEPLVLTDGVDTTFIEFENHFHIITDGYLEYLNTSNKQFYFSDSEIKRLRDYALANSWSVSEALKNRPELGLKPIKLANTGRIHLHVHETLSRDISGWDKGAFVYNNEYGYHDNDILKEVWRKWAVESGFVVGNDFWGTYTGAR